MTDFDKMMRELSERVEIPKEYDQMVDNLLDSLPETEEPAKVAKKHFNKSVLGIVFGLICAVGILSFHAIDAKANIFDTFRMTIMDIFHIGETEKSESLGVESKKQQAVSKPDLMLELKETIIDSQGMYLLVKITAPSSITFGEEIAFDYFAFCEGDNYNADKLIGGAGDCYLLENIEEKPNVATYVVSLTTDMEAYEGKNITVYFKDLTANPNGEHPELLVEGMWSITFSADLTVKEKVELEGTSDMSFPYIGTTATLERVELTPLGITILSDVSNVPFEDLGISDTTITVRLQMIDGSTVYVMPSQPGENSIVDAGSSEFSQRDGKSYQKDIYSFSEVLDITKVVGVYIQDRYVPVQ
ncbi:MAG: hypothetical protein IJ711_11135 [Lachnospiraceae bacterium]|nr:hypothetical protein [Lachnospiraceae bacterium]